VIKVTLIIIHLNDICMGLNTLKSYIDKVYIAQIPKPILYLGIQESV